MNIRVILKHSVIRKILLAGCHLLSGINTVIPKNKKQVLFYDSMGKTFYDNSRALFEYMKEHGYMQEYRLVCCIPDSSRYDGLAQKNIRVVGVIRGIWAFFRSKYVFFSFSSMRIKPSRNQIVVNQWHGTPLKKIGILGKDQLAKKESLDYFTYLLAASKPFVPIMAEAFGCSENKVIVLGHTRNDYLFSSRATLSEMGICQTQYQKCILWMPTFRVSSDHRYVDLGQGETLGDTMLPLLDNYEKLTKMNDFLKSKDVLLVIKIHNYSVFRRLDYSNIKLYTTEDLENNGIQLYEFVKDFHALLTDYSSIYFDYLLLDRPIGFTVDDFESYYTNRGFSLDDPLAYMPGHHIKNEAQLYQFIDDILEGRDLFQKDRERVNDFCNEFKDAQNCKRLLDFVGI